MRNLGIITLLATLCCAFWSCGKSDYDIPGQEANFLTYLQAQFPNEEHEPLNNSTVYRVVFDPVRMAGDTIRTRAGNVVGLTETMTEMDREALEGAGRIIVRESSSMRVTASRLPALGGELVEIGAAVLGHADSLNRWGTNLLSDPEYFETDRDSLQVLSTQLFEVGQALGAIALNMRRNGVALIGNRVVADQGDSVWFRYSGYLFSGSRYEDNLFATNIRADAEENDFQTETMNFALATTRMGTGELLRGLEIGLGGVYEGDSALLFITSDLAYGGKLWGTVPEGSPVVFKVKVERVKKN